ncbi:hypothetical protein [Spirulina major]|uniref:hypothetical protein n=1 Tax=Spirulina major TaxID=270636 RepID=UPI000934D8D8|nr:hypothetical protein [Spirulina major]
MRYINWQDLSEQNIYVSQELQRPIIASLWKTYPEITQLLLHKSRRKQVIRDPEQKFAKEAEILYIDRAFPNYCPCCGDTFSRLHTKSEDNRFCSRECHILFSQGKVTGYIEDADLVNAYFSEVDIDRYQNSIDMPRLEFILIYLRYLLGLTDIITPITELDLSGCMNFSGNDLEYIFFLFNYSPLENHKALFAALHILHTTKTSKRDLSDIANQLDIRNKGKFIDGLQILPEIELKNFIIKVTDSRYCLEDLREFLEAYQKPFFTPNDGFSLYNLKPTFRHLKITFHQLSRLGYTMIERLAQKSLGL